MRGRVKMRASSVSFVGFGGRFYPVASGGQVRLKRELCRKPVSLLLLHGALFGPKSRLAVRLGEEVVGHLAGDAQCFLFPYLIIFS